MIFRRIMQKISEAAYRGYGNDKLNTCISVLLIIILVLNFFLRNVFLSIAGMLFLVLVFYRRFSQNHAARRKENEIFLKIFNPIKAFFKLNYFRIKNFKKSRYRKCRNCHAVLVLPVKKGTHTVKCPKCSFRNQVKILF